MVAQTPQEWLPILCKRLDERGPAVAKRRRYALGDADLPEMGRNTRASWEAFQRKARTNYAGLAAGSLCNRIRPLAVTVGDGTDVAATGAARRVWRDNRMPVQIADAVWDAVTVGVGYLVAGSDEGGAVVSRELPEMFYAAQDPVRPWRARATLKVWRDVDAERDYAVVMVAGAAQVFSRSMEWQGALLRAASGGQWEIASPVIPFEGSPPVVILEGRDPRGFIEPHFDVVDRMNHNKLNRLVTTAMQAYRQRALKTADGSPGLPEKDEAGNQIDYEKVFSPAPGALWDLPEGVDIWESQQTDIRPLLEGEKADARDFAAVTQTPISVFIPEGQNQSAEGAFTAKEGQIFLADDYIARVQAAVDSIMVRALLIEGVDLGGQTVEVHFEKPAHVSLSERYAAAAQAKAAGESWKSIARNVLGYSPEQIAQDAADRAEEQLAAITLVGAVQPAVNGASVS